GRRGGWLPRRGRGRGAGHGVLVAGGGPGGAGWWPFEDPLQWLRQLVGPGGGPEGGAPPVCRGSPRADARVRDGVRAGGRRSGRRDAHGPARARHDTAERRAACPGALARLVVRGRGGGGSAGRTGEDPLRRLGPLLGRGCAAVQLAVARG